MSEMPLPGYDAWKLSTPEDDALLGVAYPEEPTTCDVCGEKFVEDECGCADEPWYDEDQLTLDE